MIYLFFFLYRMLLIPVAAILVPILALFNSKVRDGISLRFKAGKTRFPLSERPFWIHASSGEFEYAKPVIREMKRVFPHVPVLVTYFSPSYKDQVARFPGIDRFEPLPVDLPGAVHSFLNFHKPRALLIARSDLWPELLWQVNQRRIPSLLFSHTRKKATSLFNFYFRIIYSLLSEIFVVAQVDALEVAKTSRSPFVVAGDTRYDQVEVRLHERRRLPAAVDRLVSTSDDFMVLAGSTWSEDEDVLFSAFATLSAFPFRFVIVPHETDQAHLEKMKKMAGAKNLMLHFSTEPNEATPRSVAVIDQKGILADLYPTADIAFIGGSFKRKVHSVMEALGAGKIVVVGPYHANNREAVEFSDLKVFEDIRAVNVVSNSKELETFILKIAAIDPTVRTQIEKTIRAEFERHLGATAKVIDWCEFHLETSGSGLENIPNV